MLSDDEFTIVMEASDPRGVDVVAPVDRGLRGQVDASCFDRDDILVSILL